MSETVAMVLSAIVQFLKRVCILVIGLFRITYRKVSVVAVDGLLAARLRGKMRV